MTMTTTALVPRLQNLPVPVDSLESYIQAVSQVPMLSAEEEQELAQRLQLRDDLEAAQRLIVAHLRFVVHIARGYIGYGLPLGDLIQEGNVGLMKAVKRFRSRSRRAAGVVRGALDSRGNSRIHPPQLADRQSRHHQGAAQAVLQAARLPRSGWAG
jgi:hypothetical protein